MDKLKAAYDEGLAAGHYQADSFHSKMVREQNKMTGRHDMSDRANHKCPSSMKAAKRDVQGK
jgi:hypothetical protein